MTVLLFANDAATTLQSGITAAATTATLAAGTGVLFPNPIAGQQAYYTTFVDAATQQVKEIVLVTSRAGDTLTIVRGQQGTTARSWNAGDLAAQLVTAADSAQMVQPDQLQNGLYTTARASGSANSLIATLPSQLTAMPDLGSFVVLSAAANTGPATLTLTLGSTVLPAAAIEKYGGSALNAGDIPDANFPIELTFVAARNAFIMNNPASGSAGSIAGGVANDVLIQTAPGTTGFVPAPTIAGQVLAFVGGIIQWVAAAVTSFNGRSGAVVPQAGDYNAAQVGAVSTASVTGGNQQIANSGYQFLPGGLLLQWGRYTPTSPVEFVTFPHVFNNACFAVIPTGYTSNSGSTENVQASGYQGGAAGSFKLTTGGSERPVVWVAIGF